MNLSHVSTRLPLQSWQAYHCNLFGRMLVAGESDCLQLSRLACILPTLSQSLLFACLGLSQEISHSPSYCGFLVSFRRAHFVSFKKIYMCLCTVSGPQNCTCIYCIKCLLSGIVFWGGSDWVGETHSRFVSEDLGSRLNWLLFYNVSLSKSLIPFDLPWMSD